VLNNNWEKTNLLIMLEFLSHRLGKQPVQETVRSLLFLVQCFGLIGEDHRIALYVIDDQADEEDDDGTYNDDQGHDTDAAGSVPGVPL